MSDKYKEIIKRLIRDPSFLSWNGITSNLCDQQSLTHCLPSPYLPLPENGRMDIVVNSPAGTLFQEFL